VSNPLGIHSGRFTNDYTEAQNKSFTEAFGAITTAMAEAMTEELPPSSDRVQQLIKQHYDFCLQFWKPTREAYKSLAMSYILPSEYRDTYEAVAPGLGKYHYDAIVVWADENL
jgi:hypothetical protein